LSLQVEEVKRFEQAEQDKDYVLRDFESLRKEFADQYIGVVNRKVQYHDVNFDNLLETIRADRKTTQGVFIFFVLSNERTVAV